ncbi:MAG TPA: PAS domain-containing protein [Polyangiaceae bacterium]|nr:PAS domain-containing protein [Polyangiaceae bacterium]
MAESLESEVLRLRARAVELEQRLAQLAEAEEQIFGARAQAQALLDTIPHMAWMKDTRGVFLAVNEAFARACGRSKGDVLGKTDRDIWPLEHAEKYRQDDLRVIASGQQFFVEERIAEGGDYKWFETFKTPIRDGKGIAVGTVGLARDITDRKRAEAEREVLERHLQETQKLESLGVLAGGIAHDFNNLLVAVLANADLALDMLARAEPAQAVVERVADVRAAALHASELTNQMLAYSGRGHFEVRPISLTDLVLDMGQLLAASLSKKAQVTYELSELPAVQADVAQMRQVIMNLITNASDALEDRAGSIRLRTGVERVGSSVPDLYGHASLAPGNYAFLEVSDDGCGMDAETRARIFEPFFTTKFTGRGLGLSAVQGIVRGHGGGIVLRSAPHAGTTIKVLLRCADQPPVGVQSPPVDAASEWSGHGLVLLVDDDSRVRLVTTLLLRNLGFEVLEAVSGRDAIAQFTRRASEVRFVMLDVTMPDLSGDHVLRELRKLRSNVPVLLCSGYSEEEMRNRFDSKDIENFVQKPYLLNTLKAHIRHLID